MKKTSQTIIFFGSGPVAAAALELLVSDFSIEAVITKPRADHHKGDVPVLDLCKKLNLKYYTPSNKKELTQLFEKESFSSQVGLVIDYGIIIEQSVIDVFQFGILNSHFSLLPQWRGADPITFAILSGQNQTGVSIMIINDKMDEGALLAIGTHDLTGHETTPELTDELIQLSHSLLANTIPEYLTGDLQPRTQEFFAAQLGYPETPSYSRKLSKEDGKIDWQKSAEQIEREIRAFAGWPGSYTTLFEKNVIVTAASIIDEQGEPGHIDRDKKQLVIYCQQDALRITSLKPAGKKEMPIEAFLSGLQSNT